MRSDQENHKQRSLKSAVGPKRKPGGVGDANMLGQTRSGPLRVVKASGDVKTKSTEEDETYRVQGGSFLFLLDEYNMKKFISPYKKGVDICCVFGQPLRKSYFCLYCIFNHT